MFAEGRIRSDGGVGAELAGDGVVAGVAGVGADPGVFVVGGVEESAITGLVDGLSAAFPLLLDEGAGVDEGCEEGAAQDKEGVMKRDESRAVKTILLIVMEMILFMEK